MFKEINLDCQIVIGISCQIISYFYYISIRQMKHV